MCCLHDTFVARRKIGWKICRNTGATRPRCMLTGLMRPRRLTHRIAWITHADPLTPEWRHYFCHPKTIKVIICVLWWMKVVWTVSVTVVSNNACRPSMVWVVSTTERCLLAKVLTALIILIVLITNKMQSS